MSTLLLRSAFRRTLTNNSRLCRAFSTSKSVGSELIYRESFVNRHVGVNKHEEKQMLDKIGVNVGLIK